MLVLLRPETGKTISECGCVSVCTVDKYIYVLLAGCLCVFECMCAYVSEFACLHMITTVYGVIL